MPWGVFAGAVLLVYLAQTAVIGVLGWSWIDLFLSMTLMVGLLSPMHEARIASWLIGLAQDFGSTDTFGIHAFTLGLVGLLLTAVRGTLNLRPWPGRLVFAFLCGWAGPLLYALHLRFWSGAESIGFFDIVVVSAGQALIAAAAATLLTSWPVFRPRRRAGRFGSGG